MAVGDAYVFPDLLTPELTQLFFPKSPTTFLTCFCRGERRKYAGKRSRLNRGSNSQPPGHESDTLTNKPTGGPPKMKNMHALRCLVQGYSDVISGISQYRSRIFFKNNLIVDEPHVDPQKNVLIDRLNGVLTLSQTTNFRLL